MQTKDNAQFHIVLVKGWVEKDGKFLLAQRGTTELHKPRTWSLPGGKIEGEVEEDDVLEKTLKKEIKEEVNIEITDNIKLIYNNSFKRVDGAHVVSLTFLCYYKSGEAKPMEDTMKIKWFSIEELRSFNEIEDFLRIEIEKLIKYLKENNIKK
jgi:ADP-ribose pyrophosphatase YjhB (NUDIX family)